MKVIILAGDGGCRLFPLSRTKFPKQFLKVPGERTLLAQTIERFLPLVTFSDIVIVTSPEYLHYVKTELAINNAPEAHILLEPVPRNTAPAIAYAVRYCLERLNCGPEEVIIVTPSDHIIHSNTFAANMGQAVDMAVMDKIVTLGVTPEGPETSYGYIQAGKSVGNGFIVDSFREKPDLETVKEYISNQSYYWNSGIFVVTIGRFLAELKEHRAGIYELADTDFNTMTDNFAAMPNISFDYAVVEKSRQVVMLPLTATWSDMGSWDAICDVLGKDGDGNTLRGDCIPLDCSNTLILGSSRLIAGVGLQDIIIVETDDVILVAQKGESKKVVDLVENLKSSGRMEADAHTTVQRSWGFYTVIGSGRGYKMKKIVVDPGQVLSLQMHYHRSEHWIVISGTAKVVIDETESMLHENEGVFVGQGIKHRLENIGIVPLEIIEVQNGSYLGEDDIVQFVDLYGRE